MKRDRVLNLSGADINKRKHTAEERSVEKLCEITVKETEHDTGNQDRSHVSVFSYPVDQNFSEKHFFNERSADDCEKQKHSRGITEYTVKQHSRRSV